MQIRQLRPSLGADLGSRRAARAEASLRAGQPIGGERRGFPAGPLWMLLLPPLVALAVVLWGIDGPSFIPDEAATLSAVHRSFPDLLRMFLHIDAVHGPYYMFMWVVVRLGGSGELATRLPSALATAVTAAGIAALGRRLVSPRAGLAAGLVFVCEPYVSFYGQFARPYAIMTAFATFASYALVRVLDAEPGHRRGWLVAYSAFLCGLGLAQVFALPLVAAHAVTVALRCRPGSKEPGKRWLILGWLAAAGVAIAVAAPVLVLGWFQRTSLNTLVYQIWTARLQEFFMSHELENTFAIVLACGIAASVLTGRLRARWPGSFLALCLPWLIVPIAVMLGVSLITPVYAMRFVAYCIPAVALLTGAALDALGWVAGIAALTAIVVIGLPLQLRVRTATAHGSNLRAEDQIIAANRRPGDAALYGLLPTQYQQFAYPYGMSSLSDISLAQTPAESGTLTGTLVDPQVLADRLAHVSRVWLVGGGPGAIAVNAGIVKSSGFRFVHGWPPYALQLYARPRGSG
jgi:mannosyltransferase